MSPVLIALIAPFVIQAGMTFFDEFYFHHKRGLPLWEKLGHPLDTITVISCYLFILLNEPTPKNLAIYLGLVVFSSIFITKDEFVHSENSGPTEQWLHSMLFVIHPFSLIALLAYWYGGMFPTYLKPVDLEIFSSFVKTQTIIITVFMSYQILYWSVPWKKIFQGKYKSTTSTTTI